MAVITSMALPAPSTQAELEMDARTDNEALLRLLREGGGTDFNDAGVGLDNLPPIKTVTPAAKTVAPVTRGNGVSQTPTRAIAPRDIGALGGAFEGLGLTPEQSAAVNKFGGANFAPAVKLAQAFVQKPTPVNKWEVALNYFSTMMDNMKPGVTALGAAGSAAKESLAYLRKRREAEKARKAKLLPTAIAIMGAMKPPKGTIKAYTLPDGTVKHFTSAQVQNLPPEAQAKLTPYRQATPRTATRGDSVIWRSKKDAISYAKGLGLTMGGEGTDARDKFNKFVDRISTLDKSQHGLPVIGPGGLSLEVIPTFAGGKVQTLSLSPVSGTTSLAYEAKRQRLKILQKEKTALKSKGFSLLPSIGTALNLLLDGTKTGSIEEATMGFRSAAARIFGMDTSELSKQQMIEAISNKLAPGMRPAGSGATSDMEFNAYKSAAVTLKNTPFANYLSLWTLKKVTENSNRANILEGELLQHPKNYSQEYINEKINEVDTGLFAKFKTINEKGENIYDNEEEKTKAINAYWEKLPKGEVFINLDEKGEPIYRGKKGEGKPKLFLIKGFPEGRK